MGVGEGSSGQSASGVPARAVEGEHQAQWARIAGGHGRLLDPAGRPQRWPSSALVRTGWISPVGGMTALLACSRALKGARE